MSLMTLLRRPSAFVPLAMSLAALAVVLASAVIFGAGREADEGLTAHLFQFLIGLQPPIVAAFAFSWIPREPKGAVEVLGLQAAAALAALVPVFILNL